MKIHEFQAKDLLRAAGVPVLAGKVSRTPEEAAAGMDLGLHGTDRSAERSEGGGRFLRGAGHFSGQDRHAGRTQQILRLEFVNLHGVPLAGGRVFEERFGLTGDGYYGRNRRRFQAGYFPARGVAGQRVRLRFSPPAAGRDDFRSGPDRNRAPWPNRA